jgi:cytochrome P450
MSIKYNPFSESLWQDPWPTYAALRNEEPVYFIKELNAWALSRFDDIWEASQDRESFTAVHGTSPEPLLLNQRLQPEVFLFMDPPQHAAHRNLIAEKYNPRHLTTLEARIREYAEKVISPYLMLGNMNVYQYSSKVALHVIADYIGITYSETNKIRKLIDIFYTREAGHMGTTEKGSAAFAEARLYILELIAHYRINPPDLGSHLHAWFNANVDDREMGEEALFFSIVAQIITGSDTLPLSIAATLYYLARHPDQLAAVKADHALIPQAFAEAVRYDQPTNILGRKLVKDKIIRGKTLRKGQSVIFLYASANRDENEFERADCFDIFRKSKRNLSFGTGLHFCLGQHLAKLEGKIILETLFSLISEFEVDVPRCERISGEFLQGFCALPIRFKAEQ